MSITEFDGSSSWSLDASETGESTKCPWVKCPRVGVVEASTIDMYVLLEKWGTVNSLPSGRLSVYPSVCLPVFLCVHLSINLSVCLSSYLSICPSIWLSSTGLSICQVGSQTVRQRDIETVSHSAIPSISICPSDEHNVPSPLSISTAECDLPQEIC